MKTGELNTLNNFAYSNNSFWESLNLKNKVYVDDYVKLELAIFYFKLNRDVLDRLGFNERELISVLIDKNNFEIRDGKVIWGEKIFDITYILGLVKKVNKLKKDGCFNNVVNLSFGNSEINKDNLPDEKPEEDKDIKIYSRKKKRTNNVVDIFSAVYTLSERASIFERTLEVDDITEPFIYEVNTTFKDKVQELLMELIDDEDVVGNYEYLSFIASYIRLYPFLIYGNGKYDIDYSKLNIPQNLIGLAKISVSDETVDKLNKYMNKLNRTYKILKQQRDYLIGYDNRGSLYSTKKINELNKRILDIESRICDCSFSFYLYVHSPAIYNKNLLMYFIKACEQGNVLINGAFSNPSVKMFYINGVNVEFFCGMRLETLLNMIEESKLMPEESIKLEKRAVGN